MEKAGIENEEDRKNRRSLRHLPQTNSRRNHFFLDGHLVGVVDATRVT